MVMLCLSLPPEPGCDISNLCHHEPVAMVNGAKFLVLSPTRSAYISCCDIVRGGAFDPPTHDDI